MRKKELEARVSELTARVHELTGRVAHLEDLEKWDRENINIIGRDIGLRAISVANNYALFLASPFKTGDTLSALLAHDGLELHKEPATPERTVLRKKAKGKDS